MARFSGVDIPDQKRLEISLTYIYGIGRTTAAKIMKDLGYPISMRTKDATPEQFSRIQEYLSSSKIVIEGELRSNVSSNISALIAMRCYRGIRHMKKLPVRGQSTRRNARTRKGIRKTVAGKQMATK